jgi:hypothetical protein
MTDLETMKYAKLYLEKLANGINPLTNELVPDSECINQVRISRCLLYSANIIGKVIDNNGMVGYQKRTVKEPFSITKEQLSKYVFDIAPIPVSEIANKINMLVDMTNRSKLKSASINAFLVSKELLEEVSSSDDKKYKTPTMQGSLLGITRKERSGQYGTYFVNLFNQYSQQFIIDHMDEIIVINNSTKELKSENTPIEPSVVIEDMQGAPWTREQEVLLVDLFNNKTSISEIAALLKRSYGGIRARLKKLGLIND